MLLLFFEMSVSGYSLSNTSVDFSQTGMEIQGIWYITELINVVIPWNLTREFEGLNNKYFLVWIQLG